MILDIKSVCLSVFIVLVTVYGVSSYPQRTERRSKPNKAALRDDTIKGSVEIKEDGNIEGNMEVIGGAQPLNDNGNDANIESPDDAQQLNDNENDANIESPDEAQQLNDNENIDNEDGEDKNDADALKGTMEINENSIEGTIQLPSEADDEVEDNGQIDNNVNDEKEGAALTGTVEINDENIEGSINIPTDEEDKGLEDEQSIDQKGDSDAITGTIEVNDENIEASIKLPTDNYQPGNSAGATDDFITGSVEINDRNIEGHIELPDQKELVHSKENKDGFISGSIEINEEGIEGHINIPDGVDMGAEDKPGVIDTGAGGDADNSAALSGTIEINSDEIKGHINIPSDYEEGSNPEDKRDPAAKPSKVAAKPSNVAKTPPKSYPKIGNTCWMTINAKHHMDSLDKLDATYSSARQKYQNDVGKEFDNKMMEVLLQSQGAAPRAIHQAAGDPSQIPAGINLGGSCMVRMGGSVLFFHRMKLRNSTRFTVNFLNTDLVNMMQIVRLSLNDLHLTGAYERLTTEKDPSALFYVPNIGEIEILLRKVVYKMEGRLRMMNNRLIIELVNSDIVINDILMTYLNSNESAAIKLQPRNIEDFLERLKADLDFWLKDYFNDYLMYFGIVGNGAEVLQYEKKKTMCANEYADDAIGSIKKRVQDLGFTAVKLPHFTFYSVLGTEIKLLDGVLRGLDSIYRRSVATTKKEDKIRQLDFIVGFSMLKVEYKYEALIATGMPPITGKLILSADEITSHVELSQIAEPETVDLLLDTIIQTKPESLTVEGPANRLIANFKALLEHPIITIMTNTMKHNIKMMKTLTRCNPYIYGKEKPKRKEGAEPQNIYLPDQAKNNIDDDAQIPPDASDGNSDLAHNDNLEGDEDSNASDDNKDWSDYVFSKNDSMEVEVPVKGEQQKFKLHHEENVVLTKVT